MQAWLNTNLLWTQFTLCGAAIVLAGNKLSRYGDILGEKLRIGNTWVGLVLLAAITSVPELITSCTAASIEAPDIAVGNILGSNLFNLAILGMLGLFMSRFSRAQANGTGHLLSCGLSLIVVCVVLLSIVNYRLGLEKASFVRDVLVRSPIDPGTLSAFALYLVGMFLIFVHERGKCSDVRAWEAQSSSYQDESLARTCARFLIAGAIIVAAGWRMVVLGDILAKKPVSMFGTSFVLGQTVVGTFFLAVATSLPELAVCFAAVKMGAVDMAIGNVFGSNIFNVAALFFADLFFLKGPLLAHVGGVHVLTGLFVVLMSVLFILGISHRSLFIGFRRIPLSIAMLVLWLLGWTLIFAFGSGG